MPHDADFSAASSSSIAARRRRQYSLEAVYPRAAVLAMSGCVVLNRMLVCLENFRRSNKITGRAHGSFVQGDFCVSVSETARIAGGFAADDRCSGRVVRIRQVVVRMRPANLQEHPVLRPWDVGEVETGDREAVGVDLTVGLRQRRAVSLKPYNGARRFR